MEGSPQNPWEAMEPVFDNESEESQELARARVVARFALTAMFFLFVRTLLWVLEGVFYSAQAEVRFFPVGVFLVGGIALWQLLDFKGLARKVFMGLSVLTWGMAALEYYRNFHTPVPAFTSIHMAEYLAYGGWLLTSALFVVYLLQPSVRALFTVHSSNLYQRLFFAVVLGHCFYFDYKYGGLANRLDMPLTRGVASESLSVGRFQESCLREEGPKFPGGASEEAKENYCRCDSRILSDKCARGLASREQCLEQIERKLSGRLNQRLAYLEAREGCVQQYFPKEAGAVFDKSRAVLERNSLQQLMVALPLEKWVAGEEGQRKYLYCMGVALFSQCRDARSSATHRCLNQSVEKDTAGKIRTRCLRLAQAKQGEYEKALGEGERFLAAADFSAALKKVEPLITESPDRWDAFLVRGIVRVNTAQHRLAVEDLSRVLRSADFAHTRVRALSARHTAYRNLGEEANAQADATEGCALGISALCPPNHREPSVWRESADAALAIARLISEEAADRMTPRAEASLVAENETSEVETVPTPTESVAPAPAVAAVPEVPRAEVAADKQNQWREFMQVGDLAYRVADLPKAKEKYTLALRLAEELAKGGGLWVQSCLKLAAFLRETGDVTSGETYLRSAIPYWSQNEERLQRSIVEEVGRFAVAYQATGQSKSQERLLLEVWREASATDSLLVREINLHLSALYNASGRKEKLDDFFKREAEIYEKRFGKKDPRAEATRAQLENHALSTQDRQPTLASPVPLKE